MNCNEKRDYFLEEDGTCKLCHIEGCLDCSNKDTCLNCDNHKGYTLENGRCEQIETAESSL